jgi:hypothetical protein
MAANSPRVMISSWPIKLPDAGGMPYRFRRISGEGEQGQVMPMRFPFCFMGFPVLSFKFDNEKNRNQASV